MQNKNLTQLHLKQINREINFSIGDIVKVHYKIIEGVGKNKKQRIQVYEGTIIAIQNEGIGKTIIVRRMSYEIGVERIFPIYAPTISKIEKVKSNRIRRSKLYYLRDKIGKQARLKEIKKEPKLDLNFQKTAELLSKSVAVNQDSKVDKVETKLAENQDASKESTAQTKEVEESTTAT